MWEEVESQILVHGAWPWGPGAHALPAPSDSPSLQAWVATAQWAVPGQVSGYIKALGSQGLRERHRCSTVPASHSQLGTLPASVPSPPAGYSFPGSADLTLPAAFLIPTLAPSIGKSLFRLLWFGLGMGRSEGTGCGDFDRGRWGYFHFSEKILQRGKCPKLRFLR